MSPDQPSVTSAPATLPPTAAAPLGAGAVGAPPPRADRPAVIQVWRLNVRLLLATLVIVVLAAPAVYVWYKYQVDRHAAALLERARTLHEKEDWRAAAAAFHQYLQLRPEDAEAILLRAQTFDKLALDPEQRQRAVSLYFQAVRANPDRLDTRLRLAELLYENRRYEEAAAEARRVADALHRQTAATKTNTTNADATDSEATKTDELKAARLVAASLREQIGPAQRVSVKEVADEFKQALDRYPADIPLSVGYAELLRKHRDALPADRRETANETADETIDRMVARHPADPEALLARYRYRVAHAPDKNDRAAQKQHDEASRRDLAAALAAAPDNPDVLMAAAIGLAAQAAAERLEAAAPGAAGESAENLSAAATEHQAAARAHARRLLEVAPEDRRAYLAVASLYTRWNEPDEAVATLEKGLAAIGENDIELNRTLLQFRIAQGQVEEARAVLARLEPVVRRIGPYLAPASRGRLGEDLEVARAQLEVLEGNTAEALPALKRMAAAVTEGADPAETLAERKRRWQLLAVVYARLGSHDPSALAYEELLRLDPRAKEYHLLAGAEWRASGDLDRAAVHFEAATVGQPQLPAAWLDVAEIRLDQQFRKPAAETRDWRGVTAALKQARTRLGELPPVLLLQATAALARDDRPAALDDLNKLVAQKDLAPALLPRLALLLQAAGDAGQTDAVVERYRDSGAGEPQLVSLKSELLRRHGDATAAIQALDEALPRLPEADRFPLLRRLIALEIDTGLMRSARHRLRELRKARTADLWVYERAADLALVAGDYVDLKDCEDELRAIERDNGTLWRYFQAVRLLDTEKDSAEAVRQANRIAGEIEKARPAWPQMRLLRGRVAERQGKMAEAADNYELALRSGARSMTTFQWLVAALYKQDRFADAASYIRQVGQIATLSGDFSSLAVPANLQAGRVEEALRVARAAAELRPADALAQVWYAQTLALADKAPEAEEVFKKSIELAPKDVRPRSGLIWFYSRQKRPDDARQALADLVKQVDLSPLDRELVLARGSDLIGDRALAEQHYRQALADHKKDLKLLEEVGRFFFRFDHDKALDIFQQALAVDPKAPEARRSVALLWGLRGGEADWQKALGLLAGDQQSPAEDRRLQASLLLIRGGDDNVRKAIELFTGLVEAADKPVPADRLLLARAYEEARQLDEARAQYEVVLKESDTPAFLTLYAEFLGRNQLLEEADAVLARLEEKDPAAPRTIELRAAWLKAADRPEEIEALLDKVLAPRLAAAKDDNQKAVVLRYAADLLTKVQQYAPAEKKLREIIDLLPAAWQALSLWLAERGRYDEALALAFENAKGADVPNEALALVRILTLAAARTPAPPAEAPRAEEALAAALESKDAPVSLFLETGVLRLMQGRDADAIALYERALAKEPDNPVVLNNLAVVLADIPDRHAEAVRDIDQALAAVPSSPELLDSKALVLIGTGQPDEAREILERLCQQNKKNARYRLHLAIALYHLKNPNQSRREIDQALADGLDNELLTPAERDILKKITGEK